MNFYSCIRYVSPRERQLTRQEAENRRIAHAIKHGLSDKDTATVVNAMAFRLPRKKALTLVPVPGHNGSTLANLLLCLALAKRNELWSVADVLERPYMESQCKRSERGVDRWTAHALKITAIRIPPGRVFFVDNVVTSNATLQACWMAMRKGTGLVWADATGS